MIELLPASEGHFVPAPRRRAVPRWGLALTLLAVSLLTTTTLGAAWFLWTRTDGSPELFPWLSPTTVSRVWSDPALLTTGLAFSVPALFILLCHELGHYLACRRYRLPATAPYFLPAPVGIGTFGAFIRIRAPIRTKRELFDVGVSGPLAGFVALLPFLLYGVAHSEPVPIDAAEPGETPSSFLLLPGQSVALTLVTRLFHGALGPGEMLHLHPFALAAWFGLLATAINLLPLGQLDGGHILYAIAGRLQRRLALPLWIALGVAGLLWPGWLLWCLIAVVMGLSHPPVRDEAVPLDPVRKFLAAVAFGILVLSFMPVPVTEVPVS